jgi:hypothetical protein
VTPPRQVWLFELGCWTAFATAAVHLAGHVLASGAGHDTAVSVERLSGALFLVPGQDPPSPDQVAGGFSLALSLLLGTLAAAGVAVGKRGHEDPTLLRGVAKAYAVGGAVLLVVSILMFFSLQTFFIAAMALCFALASVTET